MSEMVWYVCYGSNLLEERFLCYIRGGVIPGNIRSERGAKDTTLPVRSEKCTIDHELFFSTPVKKWFDSGVAYINPRKAEPEKDQTYNAPCQTEPKREQTDSAPCQTEQEREQTDLTDPETVQITGNHNATLGRRYLITLDQFLDVVRQENALPADCELSIDFDLLKSEGSQIVLPGRYYGRLLYLGDVEGYPMLSFTCIPDMEDMEMAPLFGPYYDVIAKGLKETFAMSDEEIAAYLKSHCR